MLKDQIDLQAEVDALDKHMANLNNQNYCLQKELEGFLEADEQVRRGLDRKSKVDQIRHRVDDVIRRSQMEVQVRAAKSSRRDNSSPFREPQMNPNQGKYGNYSKSAAQNYSPLRQNEPLVQSSQRRVAYKP